MIDSTAALVEAFQRRGHDVELLAASDFSSWPSPTQFDLALYRILGRRQMRESQQIMDYCRQLILSDPLQTMLVADDKLKAAQLLREQGLQVPAEVYLTEQISCDQQLIEKIGLPPWIHKPVRGGRSFGVQQVESLSEARRLQTQLAVPTLLQHKVQEVANYRVLTTDQETLSSYQRFSPDSQITSVTHGAQRLPIEDPIFKEHLERMGRKVASAFAGDVLGVDFIYDGEQIWTLEVNTLAGFDGSDTRLADQWAQIICEKYLS